MIFTSKKKKYFLKKLWGVQCTIWDLEFKREKTLLLREELRQQYDNTTSKLAALDAQIEDAKKQKAKKEDIATLTDKKVLLERDIERYKAMMDSLEAEVHGAAPSAENPAGVQGIDDTLDAMHQLFGMLETYTKKI